MCYEVAGVPRILFRIPSCHQANVVVGYRKGAAIAKAVPIKTRPLESFLLKPKPGYVTTYYRSDNQAVLYDLSSYFNADLEKVFEQEYTSSEMQAIHWMDVYPNSLSRWCRNNPKPDLSKLRTQVDAQGRIVTSKSKTEFRVAANRKNVFLLGRWDELPTQVRLPINTPRVREVCLLIAGTTFPMQSHIANARVVLHYSNGDSEPTDLINPYNYDDSVGNFGYYHYSDNEMVELGKKTNADVISLPTDPARELVAVEVQCLSDQILFGVQAMTLYQEK